MRGFLRLTIVEVKLFLREPMAAFFTLAFPLMMLFIFGSIYGNQPREFFGGLGSVDISVPAYTALIIATTGLVSLSVSMAAYREQGILRRFQATPLRPHVILFAQVVVMFAMTVGGMLLLIIAAKVVFALRFPGRVLDVVLVFVLSSFSFFSLGFVLASLVPTTRTAQVVAMVIFYPMIFLSGATFPHEVLPEGIKRFSQVLPLTHVVALLRNAWSGNGFAGQLNHVIVLAGIMIVGVAVSAKTFRWE